MIMAKCEMKSRVAGARRRISAILAAFVMLALSGLAASSPAEAQMAQPAASGSSVSSLAAAGAGVRGLPDCASPAPRQSGTGSTGRIAINPSSMWQPRGGQVLFTVETRQALPPDAGIKVCFRWQSPDGAQGAFSASPLVQIVRFDANTLTVSATVPDLSTAPAGVARTFQNLVPLADFRVIVTAPGTETIDTIESIGITNHVTAAITALAVVAIALFLLRRVKLATLSDTPLLLRLIAAADQSASLSQFQIVLWSFLIGAAAVYVMTLSGNLIEISEGTLGLLGITGVAALGAQIHTLQQTPPSAPAADAPPAPSPEPPATPPAAPAPALPAPLAAPAPASPGLSALPPPVAVGAGPATVRPSWGDLVRSNDTIDVTRVQMLFFTLIVACFVGLTVIRTSTIPPIPQSYLLLMGISNGVYLTSKFAPMLGGRK